MTWLRYFLGSLALVVQLQFPFRHRADLNEEQKIELSRESIKRKRRRKRLKRSPPIVKDRRSKLHRRYTSSRSQDVRSFSHRTIRRMYRNC